MITLEPEDELPRILLSVLRAYWSFMPLPKGEKMHDWLPEYSINYIDKAQKAGLIMEGYYGLTEEGIALVKEITRLTREAMR